MQLARDYIFFQSVSELCLEKFTADDVQVAALFAICWEHCELKVPDATDAKLATYVLAENKKHVTELCNNVLARLYPFRYLQQACARGREHDEVSPVRSYSCSGSSHGLTSSTSCSTCR